MPQHTVILVFLHHGKQFFVIPLVIFLLRTAALEVLRPKLLIVYLMDGQDDKIQRIPREQRAVSRDGMRLHAKLQPDFDADAVAIALLQLVQLRHVARIVDIHPRAAAIVRDFSTFVPIHLDAVIHMVGQTDLIHAHRDRIPDYLLERILRVVAVCRMYMIVRKHPVPSILSPQAISMHCKIVMWLAICICFGFFPLYHKLQHRTNKMPAA